MSANAQWLFHLPILDDELLSSWLVRTAFAHGCDPLVLTGCLWPNQRVWTKDLDRSLSIEALSQLADVSHKTLNTIQNATLNPLIDRIHYPKQIHKGMASWILPLGTRNRHHTGGLQICPLCLQNDEVMFYRKSWRKAWYICCPIHQIRLIDRCPACQAAIQPHRLTSINHHMAECAVCNFNLLEVKNDSSSALSQLLIQRNFDTFIHNGAAQCQDMEMSLPQWFTLASHYIHFLRQTYRTRNKASVNFLNELGIDILSASYPINGLPFETCTIDDRDVLLQDAFILLKIHPKNMIYLMESHKISPSIWNYPILLSLQEENKNLNKKQNHSRHASVRRDKTKSAVLRMWYQLLRKI